MTTTDYHALLAACREMPDDGVRLGAFADWLDEEAGTVECPNCGDGKKLPKKVEWDGGSLICTPCAGTGRVSDGRAERAELIRVGLELENVVAEKVTMCEVETFGTDWGPINRRIDRLRASQSAIAHIYAERWFGSGLHYTAGSAATESPAGIIRNGLLHTVRGTLRQLVGGLCGRYPSDRYHSSEQYHEAIRDAGIECHECRGKGTLPGVLAGLRERPVVVEVTDREPFSGGDVSWWWIHANHGSDVDRIPDSLWRSDILSYGWRQSRRARVFPTAETARAALSRALTLLVPEVQS